MYSIKSSFNNFTYRLHKIIFMLRRLITGQKNLKDKKKKYLKTIEHVYSYVIWLQIENSYLNVSHCTYACKSLAIRSTDVFYAYFARDRFN